MGEALERRKFRQHSQGVSGFTSILQILKNPVNPVYISKEKTYVRIE
jgi:hypothetical protein